MQVTTQNIHVPKLRFNEFDNEWIKTKIQTLIDSNYITSHLDGNHGELYPRSEEFVQSGIPYVTANDFKSGLVNIEKCRRLTLERASTFKKGIAKNGDVLFAHNATVGPSALLYTSFDYVILSTTATYFRCDLDKLNNLFLLKCFETDSFVRQYSRVMSQSTRNQVPITAQRKFYLNLPTLPEQQKIASFLSSVDKRIQKLERKKSLLEDYKKGVMRQLFSQELRFKDENGNHFPDWEEKQIDELFIVTRGTVLAIPKISPIMSDENPYPVYSSQTKNNGIAGYYKEYLFEDSITWTTDGAQAGDVKFRTGKFYCTNVCGVLKSDKGFANLFIAEKLNSISRRYVSYVGNPKLMNNVMAKIKMEIPSSIKEQQKIASFLNGIDKKIELVETQIQQSKTFKKGLLQQMFV